MQNKGVQFFFQGNRFGFKNRTKLKKFLLNLFRKEGGLLEHLNIVFCTDEQLLSINRQFLKHDFYTDIITFPFSEEGKPIEAELYISIDRVQENSKAGNNTFTMEIHRVIFHGCLHLVGYNDKSSQQIKKMREREDYYLRLYFHK